jgi:hypothetical protein
VLVALSIVAALRFPLAPALHARLKALLERRRAKKPGRGDAEEAAELARLLVGETAVPAGAAPGGTA